MRPAPPAPSPTGRSEAYRSEAGSYDRRTDAFRRWRELLIQQMLQVAADRVAEHGWDNVELIAAPVAAALETTADAAVFCAVHDLMQSPARRSRRQAANCRAPGCGHYGPGSPSMRAPFITDFTDFTGFDQPWRHLGAYVPDLHVQELAFGAGYLAVGHTPGR